MLTDSIETSTDNLTSTEDIAMTSAVLILAMTVPGLGCHKTTYASGQCPVAPSKALPCAQAPTKCAPAPVACPQAPSKCAPVACPQAPSKCAPAPVACPQAPSKCAPVACPQAPSKCGPLAYPQAPIKAAPQY